MSQLKIFISSTCYDLSQIRADLNDFIVEMGYHPILSEYSSFPIDPDNDTIDNCIENVKSADIMILILGSRYGYIADTGKSITNTEYLYAKQFGVPIYVFIYKPIITIIPIWKQNPTADFSSTVDSTKIFEFVSDLRESDKTWCFDFEKAQDIVRTLKIQFSHLYQQSLEIRKKYKIADQPEFYKNLTNKSLNLILKKEDMFEVLFFLQVLKDELEKNENLKLDLEYRILVNTSHDISSKTEFLSWLSIEFNNMQNSIDAINTLFKAFKKYFGEPGVHSDLKGLYYVACSIVRVFKDMIDWSIRIRSARVDDDYLLLKNTLSDFALKTIEEIWEYPSKFIHEVNVSIPKVKEGQNITINAILTLAIDQDVINLYESELSRIKWV